MRSEVSPRNVLRNSYGKSSRVFASSANKFAVEEVVAHTMASFLEAHKMRRDPRRASFGSDLLPFAHHSSRPVFEGYAFREEEKRRNYFDIPLDGCGSFFFVSFNQPAVATTLACGQSLVLFRRMRVLTKRKPIAAKI